MAKQNDFGSVAPGKMADLVLLNANPLTDIRNTTSISAVFLMGEEFDRFSLDSVLKKTEAAVKVISPPAAAPTKERAPAPKLSSFTLRETGVIWVPRLVFRPRTALVAT